jgi:hypothetical protein
VRPEQHVSEIEHFEEAHAPASNRFPVRGNLASLVKVSKF